MNSEGLFFGKSYKVKLKNKLIIKSDSNSDGKIFELNNSKQHIIKLQQPQKKL
jgi:hypothetical protein